MNRQHLLSPLVLSPPTPSLLALSSEAVMKAIAFGIIGLVSLAAQAAVITLVNFGNATTPIDHIPSQHPAHCHNYNDCERSCRNYDTDNIGFPLTLVASASGYKLNGVDGLVDDMDVECRFTGKDVGECLTSAGTGTAAATTTVTGAPIGTVSEIGGPVPTGGNGNNTNVGNQNGGNDGGKDDRDKDGAMGLSTGKRLILTVDGVVLGTLAIF
ncbi:hypothetical protein AAF712_011363 [Marasmius tenuissimus]|uniref:Uncharacterized protein n=1 Tax=Marasmius tenuissimus TaxID=585030 RepID=A0ABR2ZKK4_9AGAR